VDSSGLSTQLRWRLKSIASPTNDDRQPAIVTIRPGRVLPPGLLPETLEGVREHAVSPHAEALAQENRSLKASKKETVRAAFLLSLYVPTWNW
jgi:hypothetical protein